MIFVIIFFFIKSNIIKVITNLFDDKVHSYSNKNGTVFIPVNQKPKAVIVFYPGGKVEHNAYNSLMYSITFSNILILASPLILTFIDLSSGIISTSTIWFFCL